MNGVFKHKYMVDAKAYTAVVDFVNSELHIYGRSFSKKFPLDDYTYFEGNMKDFVAHHVRQGEK